MSFFGEIDHMVSCDGDHPGHRGIMECACILIRLMFATASFHVPAQRPQCQLSRLAAVLGLGLLACTAGLAVGGPKPGPLG